MYFIASPESIVDVMQRGIWHSTPQSSHLPPLSPSTITIVRSDDTEVAATDLKIGQYVRLIKDPTSILLENRGEGAVAFLVEVDPKILKASDVLKIKRVASEAFEFVKNIMVDSSYILRVHVSSKETEKKLRKALGNDKHHPIKVSPDLFPDPTTEDDSFTITRPQESSSSSSTAQPKTELKICKGDLLKSSMQTHVNTVNCVGIMGKGIALAFKKQYPLMFKTYAAQCKRKEIKLGTPVLHQVSPWRLIVNFPTKGHWREKSKIQEVEKGLQVLVARYKEWGITSLAIPPLGCGNGGLEWDDVFPLMRHYLSQMDIPIEIYAPHEANAFGQPLSGKKGRQTTLSENPTGKKPKKAL